MRRKGHWHGATDVQYSGGAVASLVSAKYQRGNKTDGAALVVANITNHVGRNKRSIIQKM